MPDHAGNWVATLLPFMIIATVLAMRLRSMSKERKLKLDTLWVMPALYLLVAGSMLVARPPAPAGWALIVVGLIAGVALGWHRGKLIRIDREPQTGELRQRASPLAIVLLLAIVVLKLGARSVFGETAAAQPGSNAMLLTDGFIGFAFGLLSATRAELYLRGRRLLTTP